jgi:predicted site-specific integrase-resolvase
MNLKQWAAAQGVSYDTARRWYLAGKLPVPAFQAGRLIVIGEPVRPDVTPGQTVVYARVSSADQRPDLDRQVARVTGWATGQHLSVDKVVTEVGSALNGHRGKFLALLADPKVTTIVVEHRDRFAGFGGEYVEAAMSASGRRLLVVDPAEVDDDLVRDVTEILTSLCARLYGRRAAADRAARAVAVVTADDPS